MACVLQIGAGGVGGVVAHKMAMNKEVFSRIVLASRNIAKCAAIADSIRAKGLGEIEIDRVDADNVDEIVALVEKYKPFLVVNVALPYQDLSIMQACLQTKTHYLDTANYEHPDSAHFEYKEQWVYDTSYKQAGIFALLGSGFDPGVTNVFCAYAQKHYFDEIRTIDILDCNAGDHGYAFATNFNPEINLREVSSKARYWVKNSFENSSFGMQCDKIENFARGTDTKSANLPQNSQNLHSHAASVALATDPHLQNTRIYSDTNIKSKILECQNSGVDSEAHSTKIAETFNRHCEEASANKAIQNTESSNTKAHISIIPFESSMLDSLLRVWEDSVRNSHFFLKDSDITQIQEEVKAAFKSLQNILVAKVGDEFAGFIGVSEKSIEMLFVSPKFSHIGFGRALMCEAIDAFFVRQNEIFVDCNEENKKGLSFYQKLGFMQRSRSKTDSKGRNFPIIHFSITKAKLLANLTNDVNTDIESNLALNPDLKKDEIYRKFEREEKHFALESNTQDLKNESYFGGQWRDVAPLALMKEWEYPEVGVKNSYLLYHEELESLIRNIKGLKRIRFFMTFGESYLTHMKCLENVGLLRVDEVEHNGQKIVPIQVLKTLLPDPASLAPRTKGQTHIGCYIKGVKDGKERTIYIYNICDHEACYKEVNAQGVSYTTGVPAMIGAKLICEGKWGVGASKNSSSGNHLQDFVNFEAVITDEVTPAPKSAKNSQSTTSNTRIYGGNGTESKILECQKDGEKNVSCIADSRTQQSLTQNIRIAESDNCHSERSEESKHIESNYAQERLALNADMPKGGEYQGIDSNNGSGVWNMEQNDPDPFMRELNKQGLPYVVLEIDSNGDSKVLEDGRK